MIFLITNTLSQNLVDLVKTFKENSNGFNWSVYIDP